MEWRTVGWGGRLVGNRWSPFVCIYKFQCNRLLSMKGERQRCGSTVVCKIRRKLTYLLWKVHNQLVHTSVPKGATASTIRRRTHKLEIRIHIELKPAYIQSNLSEKLNKSPIQFVPEGVPVSSRLCPVVLQME